MSNTKTDYVKTEFSKIKLSGEYPAQFKFSGATDGHASSQTKWISLDVETAKTLIDILRQYVKSETKH